MPEKFYVANKAVILQNNKALILECANEFNPPHWDLPGGRMEANESIEAALARELQEELPSISEVSIVRHLHTYWRPQPFADGTLGVFNVFLVSAALPTVEFSSEHVSYRWVTKGEVKNLDKITQKPIAEGYRAALLLALE